MPEISPVIAMIGECSQEIIADRPAEFSQPRINSNRGVNVKIRPSQR